MTHSSSNRLPVAVACHANILVGEASIEALPGALDAIVEHGYSHVVLPPLDPAGTDAAALGRLINERGLNPITMAGGLSARADVGSADGEVRKAGAALLRAAVDFTVQVGGTQMNGVPYGVFGRPAAPTDPDAFSRSARGVGAIADYANERGITMTFEVLNRYETSVINTAEQAVDFVRQSESEHLRIHLDTFHMAIEEADMFAAIRLALPLLGYLELGQSGRGLLSTGVVDVAGIVRFAVESGYSGIFGIEAFSRSILPAGASDMLAIWRAPYLSGAELAADAARVIQRGFDLSRG
ncbi:sugar phosphate isomerase/epimerase [Cryobacterium sp. Hh7]|uniref:sugar phosphate isomerase/epimerase family protein n=1 Tax=Cryobacterium sp. Hh7 TaxID=1259159 RepID=UPI00141B4245|nr:sugar phosphate isomerase/epimerase family protein [Cryobacterium sp. Hh7]